MIGTIIYVFNLQDFFGGDANTYDFFGYALLKSWQGDNYYLNLVKMFVGETGASGWGMLYLVASLYKITGRNMLVIQYFNAVLGSATAPIIFLCAQHIFSNLRVARLAALLVAFYPSLVLWSSQGLKDGPIVFLLAVCMLTTLKLGEKLSIKYLIILACSLFALLSIRFYVFYMMVAAIAGAFIIGMRPVSAQSLLRQFVVIVAIGLSLTYFGVTRYVNVQAEKYGNLETLQRSRTDLEQRAQSGFGGDVDVSTMSGALSILPTGMLYLLFAPFPWQLASLRQSITLPEMIVWWAAFPSLILGLWFTIKYRLRQVSPILIFTSMLTLAYSLFQGNVGTAYRQRSQLLVFYFIFVAVGVVLILEKREAKKQQVILERQQIREKFAASMPHRASPQPHVWKDEHKEDETKKDEPQESKDKES
ncbi:MAG TPA: glycosyltransferase family 39 protein [Pyrinomonadaceae bacterium]|nr:glycosyltransferase family 39 protein [Pyrinomonadaceae bacterium]